MVQCQRVEIGGQRGEAVDLADVQPGQSGRPERALHAPSDLYASTAASGAMALGSRLILAMWMPSSLVSAATRSGLCTQSSPSPHAVTSKCLSTLRRFALRPAP